MVLDYDSLQKKVKHDEERRWLDLMSWKR